MPSEREFPTPSIRAALADTDAALFRDALVDTRAHHRAQGLVVDVTAAVIRMAIDSPQDLIEARQRGRALASDLGFSTSEATVVAVAISELARNIISYAGRGEIILRADGHDRLVVIARDQGPGIPDPQAAMQRGFSTSGSLGLGLPGVRRIADRLDIVTGPGGTTVTLTKTSKSGH